MSLSDRTEIKVTASDALEFEPVTPEAPKSRLGLKLFVVLVLASAGVAAWGLYGDVLIRGLGVGGSGVPLIKAAPGPVKVRPENPGGLRVPNRDKLVYDRMVKAAEGDIDGDGGRGLERLLPPPEQPLPKPSAKKAAETPKPTPKTNPVAKVPTVKDVETAKRPAPPPPPPAPPSAAPSAPGPKTTAAKPAAPVSAPAAPAPAAAPVAAVIKEDDTTAPVANLVPRGRAYLVQLAAARSSKGARTEWERLRAANRDLLGGLGLTVTKVDLGPGKGIFYRLRAGPLGDETQARNLCRQLAKRQVGCLIIKPPR